MPSKSRPMDDISNLLSNAAGALKGVGDEVKAIRHSQAEKFVADMDLVGREEFEVMKALLQKSLAEIAELRAEIAALKPKPRTRKTAAKSKAKPKK